MQLVQRDDHRRIRVKLENLVETDIQATGLKSTAKIRLVGPRLSPIRLQIAQRDTTRLRMLVEERHETVVAEQNPVS